MHSAIALLYVGAATTAVVVTGLRTTTAYPTTGTSFQCQHCCRPSPCAHARPRDSSVFNSRSAESSHHRSRGCNVWGVGVVGCSSKGRRFSSRRRAAAAGNDDDEKKDNQDWGGDDYSKYGYQPDYEMQDENSFSDQATLDEWRLQRLLTNDRWQFGMYGKQAAGDWIGSWQEYVATDLDVGGDLDDDESSGGAPMIGLLPGRKFVANTRVTRRVVDDEVDTKVFDHAHELLDGDAVTPESTNLPAPVIETLFTDSFRGENGTQVAGNTYTTAAERPSDDGLGNVWVELGLRARDVRVRCIFQYGRDAKDGAADVQRVYLVREGLGRLPPEDVVAEVELYGAAGKGLYDVHPRTRNPLYFSIYAQGGLTIRFPLKVAAGNAGVFCVDWTARDLRYQADRSFDVFDGSCSRLEVTEIGTADAEIFLPEEKFL